MSLVNAIKMHASAVDGTIGVGRWCVVQSIDQVAHLIRVSYEPEHSISVQNGGPPVLSGWIPAPTGNTTGGWSESCLPAIGQQVFCVPEMGDHEHLVAIQAGYTTQITPPAAPSQPDTSSGGSGSAPASTPSGPGERMFTHTATGAVLRMCSDGTIFFKATTVNMQTQLVVTGDIVVQTGGGGKGSITTAGTITAQGQISSVDNVVAGYGTAGGVDLLEHAHKNVQQGTSVSGPPVPGT